MVKVGRRQIDKPIEDDDADLVISLLPHLNEAKETDTLAARGGECFHVGRDVRFTVAKPLGRQPLGERKLKKLLGLRIKKRALRIDRPPG